MQELPLQMKRSKIPTQHGPTILGKDSVIHCVVPSTGFSLKN